ncbi:MAG: zf-HC2 domain-containing protein [Thermoleophilia bacterium]
MSPRPAWHADDALLRAYDRGTCDPGGAASVEAHLVGCPACRGRYAVLAEEPLHDVAWDAVLAGIAIPRAPVAVRALRRAGVSDADAVLLRAARSLDGSWIIAVLTVLAFSALAAIQGGPDARALYLLVAPLVPVLGVVVAVAAVDPLAELVSATPYSAARHALLRTVAVCAVAIPLVVLLGAAVPAIGGLAFAWLLPGLALTLIALVMLTWWTPLTTGAATGALWCAVVAGAYRVDDVAAAVGPRLSLVHLAVATCAAIVLAVRLRSAHVPGGLR